VGFTALDLNGDGVLDAKEIDAASASLAKLDKNRDGQITSDEARPAMSEGRGGGPGGGRGPQEGSPADIAEETVKVLMAFDANGDGKLSKDELPERFQGIFDRADVNKDGFLTPDEIRKVAAAQAPPEDAGGRGGGEGGRGGRDGGRGEMNFIRMDPILAAIDANGDGVISAAELRSAPAAIRTLDKHGDGQIRREEVMPAAGRRGGN
jgi:Ca2+-binding EF-hand superfamily protein